MARRMLVWDDDLYRGLNDAGRRDGDNDNDSSSSGSGSGTTNAASPTASPTAANAAPRAAAASSVPPRWRPARMGGVSNVNPAFRTEAPVMNNAGYAGVIRRNSRKRNKPSMWRHALRVHVRMGELERMKQEQKGQELKKPSGGACRGDCDEGCRRYIRE